MRLTAAQKQALAPSRRSRPAGEPRLDWLNTATARLCLSKGWIVEREGAATRFSGSVVDLTPAGRLAAGL